LLTKETVCLLGLIEMRTKNQPARALCCHQSIIITDTDHSKYQNNRPMKPLTILLFLLALAATAHAYEDPALAVAAAQYRQAIQTTHPRDMPRTQRFVALGRAENHVRAKQWDDAIGEYETAIAGGADATVIWLQLSQMWQEKYNKQRDEQFRQRALQAAYNGYRTAQTPDEQARALFALGQWYDPERQPKLAIAALAAGLEIEDNPRLAQKYQQLVAANAFQVKGVETDADRTLPRFCLKFSHDLQTGRQIQHQDYLVIDPPIRADVSARDQRLCVTGVEHGQRYQVTLRPGLAAASGEKIQTSATFTVTIEHRPPSLGFRGSNYVLPRLGGQQLPLTSVNVDAAKLTLLRINDRNLSEQINDRRIATTLRGYDINAIAERSGEQVWEGELTITGERNQEITTAIPVGEILENTQPGIYVIAAAPADAKQSRSNTRATQWLVVSDLGLSTFKGRDGLHVFVRSLDSAKPLNNIDLRLYARNNSELGRATTNAEGYVRFDPGLLRGSGGREPAALMAYHAADFNFLDLTRPAFDLSDRGVAGRAAPGPVDAFLYTERGVYRPGETVELMALLRDSQGYAQENLPLTLKLIRPDEVELAQIALTEDHGGGLHARLPLAANARTGTWTVRAHTDPEAQPVGQLKFQVEDFVPQTLRLELQTDADLLKPGETATVAATGQFLYGAPAANLKTKAEIILREDGDPYPDYPNYRFGLVQESWTAKRYPLPLLDTDAQGETQAVVRLDEIPDTGRLLKAVVQVSLFEPGGRPVNRSLGLPYRIRPLAIGIRPEFPDDAVQLGQSAAFSVIAVDPTGQRLAVDGLRAELFREDYEYYWYYKNNRWDYKLIIRDSEALLEQTLDLSADQPATITQQALDWGRYRLEVFDPKTGAASSVRFNVGWFVEPSAGAVPDQLRITLDKPRYQIGETARVQVTAPFAGEVLLTVVTDRLWTTRRFHLPEDGATFDLPIEAEWGPGVYLTATAFRPAENPNKRGPGRAIGVTWLALDPQPRTLTVQLDAPKELTPRQTFTLPVSVEGVAAGEPAWLTVAAVDEGILQLTDFATPDPVDYFLGKRRLGVDLLDLYGQLIETGGRPGQLRSGGDAAGRQLGGPGVRTVKTVALFSGPLALDAQGQAQVPLELPDFNGELRLMAIAWDRSRLGQADVPLLVRDPLIAQAYLPRFLAPEDVSRITLNLQNLSAPAGIYRVRLNADGAIALADDAAFEYNVTASDSQTAERRSFELRGVEPGAGRIQMRVDGPANFQLSREWEIGVRPAQAILTEREASRLAPGKEFTATTALTQDFLPGTGQVNLSFATRPNLDVPGLLAQLDRFPYGCVEQTISRALPLLYFEQTAQQWGVKDADSVRERVQGAIQRLLSMQRYDGGFGLWSADSSAERWLSAYALDFLTRAREQDYLVPAAPYQRGLDWLKDRLHADGTDEATLLAKAYALYVLARAGQAPIGELRYLHDNYARKLPTVLAQAQLAAALARYGELNRAREAFELALAATPNRGAWRDYGSPLRDRAALTALLSESRLLPDAVPTLVEQLAAEIQNRRYTSTQEQAWLLLAAQALLQARGTLNLTVNGQPVLANEDPFYLRPTPAELAQGVTVVNRGRQPVWVVANRSGVPVAPLPPTQEGFAIARRFYDRSGQAVDPNQVKQNDLLVAVITGEALTDENHQALIVDLLPAGLEIENARLAHNQSTAELRWLPKLSKTLHTEFRDDRFVAALDLNGKDKAFAVAYLARAVTPGEYRLPAVFVEDMYKPWYRGRGALGRLVVE